MKLLDLQPEFLRIIDESTQQRVPVLEGSQGLMFLCPRCFEANGGEVGTHAIIAWFRNRGVPDDESPGPGRWDVQGTGFADLTLRPSIHLSGPGCGWHGFVTNGEITTC